MDQFAKFKHANISNFKVVIILSCNMTIFPFSYKEVETVLSTRMGVINHESST